MYVTGAGQTVPASTDGEIYTDPLPLPTGAIAVQASSGPLTVPFSAPAYGLADGIFQVNVQLPYQVTQLRNLFTLSIGGASVNFVVSIR
jgi:uncharacterized protein (TIGR03437 family)